MFDWLFGALIAGLVSSGPWYTGREHVLRQTRIGRTWIVYVWLPDVKTAVLLADRPGFELHGRRKLLGEMSWRHIDGIRLEQREETQRWFVILTRFDGQQLKLAAMDSGASLHGDERMQRDFARELMKYLDASRDGYTIPVAP